MRTHVVVAGAGMGGLTAAVTALQAGAEVTLLEKSGRAGGSAALSNGMLIAFGELERFRAAAPNGDELLQTLVHETLPAAADWLTSLGVELHRLPRQLDRYDGWHFSADQYLGLARDEIRRLGAEIRYNTALDRLWIEDSRVQGVHVVNDTGAVTTLRCDTVILATGGFQGSPELLARYAGLDAAHLAHRANPFSTGDGLAAAVAAGAGTSAGLGGFYGHALPAPPARLTAETFAELAQYYGSRSVALNMAGRRFVDETFGAFEENVNHALAHQPGGLGFYVFDAELAGQPSADAMTVTPAVIAERAERAGGAVVRAETLDELARQLAKHGVPRSAASTTLRDYAQAMATGATEQLDVPRTGVGTRLAHGPFTAVHVQAAITFTTGGLAVDDSLRVLRRSGSTAPMSARWITDPRDHRAEPVPGLYAVGADIGGVSAGGYAGGLATALTTGRAAARDATASR
ncbi:FAD-binding protein [Streptomyces sp. NPDC091215]|uniref:FAD-binding protein n=1 Tax=Streptomyces sp. NPDC091215 TaxID=3155192 RepID=UPI00343AD5AB